METKIEIIPIFPTPLGIIKVPDQLIQNHIFFLDQEEIINMSNEYGGRSKNSYLFSKNEYINLSNYILQQVTYYTEKFSGYNYINYKFSQSWISVKHPNEEHIPHTHPNSLISGVLFYGQFQEDSSSICFYRKDNYSKSANSHKLTTGENLNDFMYTRYYINYTPNLLILFPSYLKHSVSKNLTNIPRKSLAFNIIPRDGFGSEENLTELKFN